MSNKVRVKNDMYLITYNHNLYLLISFPHFYNNNPQLNSQLIDLQYLQTRL